MLRISTLLTLLAIPFFTLAQEDPDFLPRYLTVDEIQRASEERYEAPVLERALNTPPSKPNIRAAAQWEEVQAITISWKGYTGILKQIVHASVNECEVVILTENPENTQNFLLNNDWGGPVDMTNVSLVQTNLNSIWIRDYGANTVYGDEVDDLFLVDWVYNRPRPLDDVSPQAVADYFNLELYSTTTNPWNLWNCGGNFMQNGNGQAFASNLILNENQGGNSYWGAPFPNHSEAQIDNIQNQFLGIDEYIKMTVLPFDGINHIDMHMKLLDEETLLVSEYPQGVSDGPQIEANLQYIQNNFTTRYGTPYKIVRVPAPPQFSNGNYPPNGWYNTYANGIFVNNTFIVPTYYEQYDTTAMRILQEAMPGYNIVGIDVDNQGQALISAGGAIHCITQTVGVNDPLLITYQSLPDTGDDQNDYSLTAYLNHASGVASANLYFKTALEDNYTAVAMTNTNGNNWSADITAQPFGTTVHYYVEGTANNGKVQTNPMPAPAGYRKFDVINEVFGCTDPLACNFLPEAIFDDGSCIPGGCTNANACNFDPDAECDNGTCAPGEVTLTLSTDCWGGEVSWDITDDNGNIIANAPQGSYGNTQSYSWSGCLSAGCYTFNIYDGYGDGMAGGTLYGSCNTNGNYFMNDNEGNTLFQMGNPNYGTGTSHAFCINALESPQCLGDFDGDGMVTTNDLLHLLAEVGCMTTCTADLNNDGIVNTADMLVMLSLFGSNCD